MSDALHPIRLYWNGHARVGVARHGRVAAELDRPPCVRGLETATEIDFVPHVICHVRRGAGPSEDLTADEQHDIMALLQAMSTGARDQLDGCTSLVIVQR